MGSQLDLGNKVDCKEAASPEFQPAVDRFFANRYAETLDRFKQTVPIWKIIEKLSIASRACSVEIRTRLPFLERQPTSDQPEQIAPES